MGSALRRGKGGPVRILLLWACMQIVFTLGASSWRFAQFYKVHDPGERRRTEKDAIKARALGISIYEERTPPWHRHPEDLVSKKNSQQTFLQLCTRQSSWELQCRGARTEEIRAPGLTADGG